MLSEKQLGLVQGGWFIDLTGITAFLGGVFGGAIVGGGGSYYTAHDTSGQYGHVAKAEVKAKPLGLGKVAELKTEHIVVLNADHMQDLKGASIAIGATATLPSSLVDTIASGGKHVPEMFGILYDQGGRGIGGEVSIPLGRGGTQGAALIKTITDDPAKGLFVSVPGMPKVAVDTYASVSFSDVKVDKVDRHERSLYDSLASWFHS